MKKLIVLYFLFYPIICYSQTWVERVYVVKGVGDITQEYTVISKEQFDRLIQQYKENNEYCRIQYTDVLDLANYPVISGTRPTFNGYYFLHIKKRGQYTENHIFLVYGHPNTGRMELEFHNGGPQGDVKVKSNEYLTRWNRYVGWVNGEY